MRINESDEPRHGVPLVRAGDALDYAPPERPSGRLALWGSVAALVLSAACLLARLAREAGFLDQLDPVRRLAGNPVTSASLGFAALAGVLASVLRVQVEQLDTDAARRGKSWFPVLLGLAAALATLSGFILL